MDMLKIPGFSTRELTGAIKETCSTLSGNIEDWVVDNDVMEINKIQIEIGGVIIMLQELYNRMKKEEDLLNGS